MLFIYSFASQAQVKTQWLLKISCAKHDLLCTADVLYHDELLYMIHNVSYWYFFETKSINLRKRIASFFFNFLKRIYVFYRWAEESFSQRPYDCCFLLMACCVLTLGFYCQHNWTSLYVTPAELSWPAVADIVEECNPWLCNRYLQSHPCRKKWEKSS